MACRYISHVNVVQAINLVRVMYSNAEPGGYDYEFVDNPVPSRYQCFVFAAPIGCAWVYRTAGSSERSS